MEIGAFRRFLFRLRADIWGPPPLQRWLWGDDPKDEFFSRVARDIVRRPEDWTSEPYGLANHADSIRIYAVEGVERVAVAADDGILLLPSAYWRELLLEAVQGHRDWREMQREQALADTSGNLAVRLISR